MCCPRRGLDVLDEELVEAREAMAKDPTEERIHRFSELEEEYGRKGGYEAEAAISRLADGLGLDEGLLLEDIDGLSGGQRRRVDLIRVLFSEPNMLVLDEPTNHLDRSAKRWLMEELERFPGSVLLISHDLRLLDGSITKILNLAHSELTEHPGTYTAFRASAATMQAQRERASTLEGRQITRLKERADAMRGSSAKRARTAKALDSRVARLQSERTVVGKRERASHFKLPTPRRSATVPMTVDKLSVRYDGPEVLHSVSFVVGRGDRIAVVGRNGAGKSSLLRCLAGEQVPSSGSVSTGVNVTIGYFAQEHEQLDPNITVLDNVDDTILTTDPERRGIARCVRTRGRDRVPVARHVVRRREGAPRACDARGGSCQSSRTRRAHEQPRPRIGRSGRGDASGLAWNPHNRQSRPAIHCGSRADALPDAPVGAV